MWLLSIKGDYCNLHQVVTESTTGILLTVLLFWYLFLLFCYKIDGTVFVAGQVPLVPGSMEIIDGGIAEQCWLSLRHVSRILHSIYRGCNLCNVIRCVCYVDHPAMIPVAKIVWDKYICELQVTVLSWVWIF